MGGCDLGDGGYEVGGWMYRLMGCGAGGGVLSMYLAVV